MSSPCPSNRAVSSGGKEPLEREYDKGETGCYVVSSHVVVFLCVCFVLFRGKQVDPESVFVLFFLGNSLMPSYVQYLVRLQVQVL